MTWLLLAGIALLLVRFVARRRRNQFPVAPADPMSPMTFAASKRHPAKVRAALDAASSTLR
jgi:hypothetical protein